MDRLTYLNHGNAAYVDSLYEAYQHDPGSIEFGWQKFFEGFDFGAGYDRSTISGNDAAAYEALAKEINVLTLIDGYRSRGHLFAKTNPVRKNGAGISPEKTCRNLWIKRYRSRHGFQCRRRDWIEAPLHCGRS